MTTQMRDYRIVAGSLDQFVEEWQREILPIRRGLGFTVPAAWTVEDESRFVWLLSHPGDWTAFDEADRGYHTSPQRAALDPNPARLIEEQRSVRLEEVELS